MILGVEVQVGTSAGSGLTVCHGQGLVVHEDTEIGNNVTLRHNTTIGNRQLGDGKYSAYPKIGDNVNIGSNSAIIGEIKIGKNSVIGSGSVVVQDVPENAVVAGNPA